MHVRAQAILPFSTNLPRDVITNTFYFRTGGALEDLDLAAAEITDRLAAFYDAIYDEAIAQYITYANARLKCYDMDAPEPRVPVDVPLVITPGATAPGLPTEVAAVISFHAAIESGVAPARRRGRVFIGALTTNHLASPSATIPAWDAGAMQDLEDGANALLALNDADCRWVQYSPTTSVYSDIIGGWIDNSPDTQRRRSVEASSRQLWP